MNKHIRFTPQMILCGFLTLFTVIWLAIAGAESGTVVTGGGRLNMRAAPENKARIITKIKNGATVEVLDLNDEWAHITYEKYEGYVQ